METIDDILREMLALGRLDEKSTDKIPRSLQALGLRTYAKRIKAAHEHETVKDCHALNAAKMREALKYLRDASREFHHLILNSKHNEICDKYKYAEVAKISDAIANANFALAAPARNCDLYATEEEAWEAFCNSSDAKCPQYYWDQQYRMWLLAEAKGEK